MKQLLLGLAILLPQLLSAQIWGHDNFYYYTNPYDAKYNQFYNSGNFEDIEAPLRQQAAPEQQAPSQAMPNQINSPNIPRG